LVHNFFLVVRVWTPDLAYIMHCFYQLFLWDVFIKLKMVNVMSEIDEDEEWSVVHKTWYNERHLIVFRRIKLTSKWEGSWDLACMRLHGRRKTYQNYLILSISTKCIFFLLTHSIKTPQFSILDLDLFWDGRSYERFLKNVRVKTKHAEKTRVDLWGQSTMLKTSLCYSSLFHLIIKN
jgi:hypothetical protein